MCLFRMTSPKRWAISKAGLLGSQLSTASSLPISPICSTLEACIFTNVWASHQSYQNDGQVFRCRQASGGSAKDQCHGRCTGGREPAPGKRDHNQCAISLLA